MSRYVEQQEFADPFVLDVVDRDEPHAGPGEVRVRVFAAGLNPVDWKLASIPAVAEAYGITAPAGFGNDFAGAIDEVGEGVDGWRVGDRVLGGARSRAVAEHVVVSLATEQIVRTPERLDDVRAAALQIAARTADAAVHAVRVASGDTVLIGGAAGGVGVIAVQLAVHAGATVIATASAGNHEFLRGLGAVPTIYGDGLVDRVLEAAPDGVDAAIDLQGTATVEAAIALGVAPERIATIAVGPKPPHGVVATGGSESTEGALERIAQAVADGTIVLPIAETFPIDRIDDAVALQRGGHVRGKVVVTI